LLMKNEVAIFPIIRKMLSKVVVKKKKEGIKCQQCHPNCISQMTITLDSFCFVVLQKNCEDTLRRGSVSLL